LKKLGLTYCTNVHPLGDWATWSDIVGRFGPAIRAELGALGLPGWGNQPMGLWFPASLVAEMDRDPQNARQRLISLFSEHNLSAFTCNGFPYGNFHDKVVKTKVYHPDWTRPERLAYTVACARLLSLLVPVGGEGSLSTLPLGWRMGWNEAHSRESAENICAYVREARSLREMEGRTIRLGLEPEPGCVLETIDQVLAFWDAFLRPAARNAGVSDQDLLDFCGLCYDTCHQAVQFEEAVEALDRLAAHGIPIVKMQLSSALEFTADARRESLGLRRQFVEERFLHQTRVRTAEGIIGFDDLPEALAADRNGLWAQPWRVHFHLPIDSQSLLGANAITTTRDEMLKAYRHALQRGLCRHFEVETYTWSVLPLAHRPKDDAELARSIARELAFIQSHTPAGTVPNA
jgi:sugar phosphate isomerase/epimerase